MKNKLSRPAAVLLAGGAAAFAAFACSERLKSAVYAVATDKIKAPVRILHISDLHSSPFGRDQCELIEVLHRAEPDLILMTGDIADNRIPNDNAYAFAEAAARFRPCFYVSGNHEFYAPRPEEIFGRFRACGVKILAGDALAVETAGGPITLGGIDDPYGLPDSQIRFWEEQLADVEAVRAAAPERFSILLTHRPEPVSAYAETGFDLILAGHAHGGQIVIPGLVNGLFAPHQGLFPAYAGGRYELRPGQTMIVSRGLSKHVRPRVFNRPEWGLILLTPS